MNYKEPNDRTTYMTPEARCLDKIDEKGFSDEFQIVNEHSLLCLGNNKVYSPDEINVVNFYRFEGTSNPDDMSIIYVIEGQDGTKGTLTDAFGIYADEVIGAYMNQVTDFHKITARGWGRVQSDEL
jgi:hypothetical protein